MQLPPNMTEGEVLEVIDRIARRLARRYRFGYLDLDDVRQQARQFAVDGMLRYDHTRPLENFLMRHVRNRLSNYKRDHFHRSDAPCRACAELALMGGLRESHGGAGACPKYAAWARRNSTKANLSRPTTLADAQAQPVSRGGREAEAEELAARVDRELCVGLRPAYLRMRAGEAVSPGERAAVEGAVLAILRATDERA